MSICTFLASHAPLPPYAPPKPYPFHANLDNGTIDDGDADDNYFLYAFPQPETYTDKPYAVSLEWNYTDGRCQHLIDYIRAALQETDTVEIWHVWLMEYWEFDERPVIHRKTTTANALTAAQIREIDAAEIWNTPDQQYPNRPSFYCLTVTR